MDIKTEGYGMAEETMVEKAAKAVGFGLAMAEDVAAAVKTAFDAGVTTVTEALKTAPAKKTPTKKAPVKKVPAKKATVKKAVKKAPSKKAVKKTAKRAIKKTAKKAGRR